MSSCTMPPDWYNPAASCGEQAIGRITFACIREHIDQRLACMSCAAEVQQSGGTLICDDCDAAGAHEWAAVTITWLDGSPPTPVQDINGRNLL